MQLRVARLCLDCEEIHDAQHCPVCGSESFAYISRWIPAPERRHRPRPTEADENAETYRQLLDPHPPDSATVRWMKRGAFGLAAVGVAQWIWRRTSPREMPGAEPAEPASAPQDESVNSR